MEWNEAKLLQGEQGPQIFRVEKRVKKEDVRRSDFEGVKKSSGKDQRKRS